MSSSSAARQRRLARRAFWGSVAVGLVVVVFFVIREELVTAIIVGFLLFGWGYAEYRRRLGDLDAIDSRPETEEDPFERRDRFR